MIYLGCLFLIFIFIYFSPVVVRYYQQYKLNINCKRNNWLVLTYDDGPGNELTPKLFEILDTHRIKATFFLSGSNVDVTKPALIKKILKANHEIGCHGFNHLNAWKVQPLKAIRDIKQGFYSISKFGLNCKIFRPPYGKVNIFTWFFLKRNNIRLGWWTDVSGDTYKILPDPDKFVSKIIQKGGGVVLLHDFDRSKERKEFVLTVTKLLITRAKENGFKIKTLGEIL